MCLHQGIVAADHHHDEEKAPSRLDRRTVLLGGAGAALAALMPTTASAATGGAQHADLTHVFREGFPVFGFEPPERRTLVTIRTGGFYS